MIESVTLKFRFNDYVYEIPLTKLAEVLDLSEGDLISACIKIIEGM